MNEEQAAEDVEDNYAQIDDVLAEQNVAAAGVFEGNITAADIHYEEDGDEDENDDDTEGDDEQPLIP